MTLSKEELSALIERVRGLKGADRDVDAAMAKIAGWHPNGYGCKMPDDVPAYWYSDAFGLPSYTGSVDAAIDLAERVLPGWSYELTKTKHCVAEMWLADENGFVSGNYPHVKPVEAATLPLAIILALLLSLQSQEPTP
jgi:hypothetical protein